METTQDFQTENSEAIIREKIRTLVTSHNVESHKITGQQNHSHDQDISPKLPQINVIQSDHSPQGNTLISTYNIDNTDLTNTEIKHIDSLLARNSSGHVDCINY